MIHQDLIKKYPLISDQIDQKELTDILFTLETLLKDRQDLNVTEFGCYSGTTALFIQRLLLHYKNTGEYHVYDSFEGLPPKASQDQSPTGIQFKAGELSYSKKNFQINFKKAGLKTPFIHKGWFSNLEDQDIPSQIDFAFLDGDFYESVKAPLELISSKLSPKSVVIVDDYANEALPGAAIATNQWLKTQKRPYQLKVSHSLAVIKMLN